jgi:hypothetical protein
MHVIAVAVSVIPIIFIFFSSSIIPNGSAIANIRNDILHIPVIAPKILNIIKVIVSPLKLVGYVYGFIKEPKNTHSSIIIISVYPIVSVLSKSSTLLSINNNATIRSDKVHVAPIHPNVLKSIKIM